MPRPLSTTVTTPSALIVADDRVAVAAERFVDRVVDDFADEVVQTALIGAADIHARPAADGFEPFEHLDRTRIIFGSGRLSGRHELILLLFERHHDGAEPAFVVVRRDD